MTWKPVAVAVLSCALLAACSASSTSDESSAASVDTPSSSPSTLLHASGPTTFDDGALIVEPVPGPLPTAGREQAARALAGSSLQSTGSGLAPVVAHVTLTLPQPPASDARLGVLGSLDLTRAWVYLAAWPQDRRMTRCGFQIAPTASPAPGAHPSAMSAVIVDDVTGHAYLYSGTGEGPCGYVARPRLIALLLQQSVPYTLTKLGPLAVRLTVSLPACGRMSSFTPSYYVGAARQGQAMASVTNGACAGLPSSWTEVIHGRVIESPHGPLGLICGETFDAQLGRPADCVA